MKSGIYSITNIINKKIYIGSALFILKRWRDHRSKLNLKKHHNPHLQSAWNQYGESNFKFEVVEYCDTSQLINLEKHYIDQYDSKNRINGYNVNDPEFGFLGIQHTDKTKQILSLQKLGSNNPMFGLTGNTHHNFGKKHSINSIVLMKENRKGKGGQKGESQPNSKLSTSDVLYIRANYKTIKTGLLAKKFNVTHSTISMIGTRKRWTHI